MNAKDTESYVRAVRLHPEDTVAVLVEEAAVGNGVRFVGDEESPDLVIREPIPYGHKVAVRPMRVGAAVLKYGEPMGIATEQIAPGFHVHVHNVRGLESDERGGGDVGRV